MTKEEICDLMRCARIEPHPLIECEFEEDKPCMELYGRVCDARLRISERAGLDFEDRDIMEIVECMEKIAEICALKMYDYGVRYGKQVR